MSTPNTLRRSILQGEGGGMIVDGQGRSGQCRRGGRAEMRGMHQRMLHAATSPTPVGGNGVEVLHQLGLQSADRKQCT